MFQVDKSVERGSGMWTKRAKMICRPERLNVGLVISRTNAKALWNSVYNVFHRIFFFGNETVRQ